MGNKNSSWPLAILFGSLWGFFEATLGGFLHLFNTPLTGQVMGAIGAGVMFWALRSGVRPALIPLVATVAASFKFADSFLFGLPVFDIKIINPAQAILMQGMAFAVIARTFKNLGERLVPTIVPAALFVSISMVLFNLISYFAVGYKTTSHLLNPVATLLIHMPVGIVLTSATLTLLARGAHYQKITGRIFELGRLRPAWIAGISACLVTLAITVRGLLG